MLMKPGDSNTRPLLSGVWVSDFHTVHTCVISSRAGLTAHRPTSLPGKQGLLSSVSNHTDAGGHDSKQPTCTLSLCAHSSFPYGPVPLLLLMDGLTLCPQISTRKLSFLPCSQKELMFTSENLKITGIKKKARSLGFYPIHNFY